MAFDPAEYRNLYPFENRWFVRHGLRMHYVDEGAGDPVVMVHGNPTWSFYFRRLIRDLSFEHRCIAPDHIGCGLSDKPQDDRYDYRLKSRIDDLEALLEHLGVKQNITLVLHDWGGAIGMGYAARHPERISRLVLMNTAAFPKPSNKTFPAALWLARDFGLGGWFVRRLNAFALTASHVCATKGLDARVRAAYLAPYDSFENRIATLRFVQDIPLRPADPSWEALEEIRRGLEKFRETPTRIFWGHKDFVFDRPFLEVWKRELPQAEVTEFTSAGHYVLEDEAAVIVPAVRRFLAQKSYLPARP